jgi:ATP-dependent DNA ligase
MEDITPYVKQLVPIREMMSRIPAGSMVLAEMVYFDFKLKKEIPRHVASVIRKEDAEEASARYAELEFDGKKDIGYFRLIPFDTLFWENKFVGNTDYQDRYMLLKSKQDALFFNVPDLLPHWKEIIETAKKQKWEGFILRVPGEKSHVSYTMDGKAHRAGSWKYKFLKEGDFFVDEVLMGKSGKHAGFYAKFHLAQYDEKGSYIDRGYCGCGTFSHDQLVQLTKDINSKKIKLPFVFEVEYQSIHDETGKLEFGQPQGDVGVRTDKVAAECITEG